MKNGEDICFKKHQDEGMKLMRITLVYPLYTILILYLKSAAG